MQMECFRKYDEWCESRTIEDEYQDAKTFRELCNINVKFLKGIYDHSAYHMGPVDEETVPLVQNLCLLNSLGCYTFNGQPSRSFVKRDGDHSVIWRCYQSRGYLDFFISDEHVSRLKDFLSTKDVYYAIESSDTVWSTIPIKEGQRFPLHREALIVASGFDVTQDTFKTAHWKKSWGASIPYTLVNTQEEIDLHVEAGVDEKIFKECATVVVTTKDFASHVSLEMMMIEFMYSTF
jgi:hypothetical protein